MLGTQLVPSIVHVRKITIGSVHPHVALGRLIIRVIMRDGPEVPMLIDRTSGPALWGFRLMISAPIQIVNFTADRNTETQWAPNKTLLFTTCM